MRREVVGVIKWIKSLFYIHKYGKVSERAFLSRMASSLLGIVICMAAIALTAYAHFSCTIISATQVISAASYDCVITIDRTYTAFAGSEWQ